MGLRIGLTEAVAESVGHEEERRWSWLTDGERPFCFIPLDSELGQVALIWEGQNQGLGCKLGKANSRLDIRTNIREGEQDNGLTKAGAIE